MELTVIINIFLTFVMNEALLEPNLHPAELEINQWNIDKILTAGFAYRK